MLDEAKISEEELYSDDADTKKKVMTGLEKVKKDTIVTFAVEVLLADPDASKKANMKTLAKTVYKALIAEKSAKEGDAE